MNLLTDPEVQKAIENRIRARALENVAKKLKEKADSVLICQMVCYNQKSITHPEYGVFNYIAPGTSKTVDKKKLKEGLINRGVAVEVINVSFEEATTEKDKAEYITFKEKKKL